MSSNSPEARELTKDFSTVPIAQNIANDKNSTATKLASLISTGQSKLTAAQVILDNAASNEAVKIGKDAITTLLAPAKDVVALLDLVAQVHPAVQVAVGVIKVVVQLELNRLDNDKHIAALYFTMSDLLFVLADLDPMFKDNDGLEKQLKSITDNINNFGNFCDEYYKHKSIVRTIFSTRYKGQLATFATTFTDQKSQLQFLVNMKSAETVTAMKGSLDTVSKNVDRLIEFLEKKSPGERDVVDMVESRGGAAAVIGDEKLLNSIASKLGEKMNSDIQKDMKFTLRWTLDEALQANQACYDLKFDALQSQIEHAIAHSTEAILTRLDSGPHNLINDEDIRAVWKGEQIYYGLQFDLLIIFKLTRNGHQQWRLSCKIRHFVDAIHHHFSQKFLSHQQTTGEKHPDFWTLNYMSKVIFYPAIGDAIDQDSSGYLSVIEVNHFFERKPQGWSSCEWIAYWAAGWYKNTILFKNRCLSLLDSLETSRSTMLQANKDDDEIKWYFFDNDALPSIRVIVDSIYTNIFGYLGERFTEGHDKLHALRTERMTVEIETMKAQLTKPKYQLNDVDSVLAVCGTRQMELSFLCLTYLLLSRHKKILDLAQTYVLSDEEFWVMSESIESLQDAFDKRYRELMECWRQQRLDINVQLESFAAGMFEDWHNKYYDSNDDSDSDEEESEPDNKEKGNDKAAADDEVIGDKVAGDRVAADGDGEKGGAETKAANANADEDDSSDSDSDDASVDDVKVSPDQESEDPKAILVFPLPSPQPDVATKPAAPVKEDEHDDDDASGAPKKKKETKLERKVTALAAKLDSIEKLLQEVLVATKAKMQP
ncbi:hypothetical protein PILCRDRAFT_10927 [Piloderma croceum F 1598]|uniref:EF-hand domain-containing protein n=1 Tax=Piloderma croceum (strain F 1598) TaxID=765440 RepID=A0A0C3FFE0_PILCF|nr:hypothetical protein PILCRDRAFT_10927 [Piloderma croceum F 1598]